MTTELNKVRALLLGHWNGTIGIEGEEGAHEIVVRIPFGDDYQCKSLYESILYLDMETNNLED